MDFDWLDPDDDYGPVPWSTFMEEFMPQQGLEHQPRPASTDDYILQHGLKLQPELA